MPRKLLPCVVVLAFLCVSAFCEEWKYREINGLTAIVLECDPVRLLVEREDPDDCNYSYDLTDENGKVIVERYIDYLEELSEGFSIAGRYGETDAKYAYMRPDGTFLTDFCFEDAYSFSEGLAYVKQNGLYGYIDTTGVFVIEPQFDNAYSFSEGLARVQQNGLFGFIDTTGAFVVEPQFADAYSFSEGLASVKQNGLYGYIDTTGAFVAEPQFVDASYYFSEGLAYVKQNGLYGYIDTTGAFVLEPAYSYCVIYPDNTIYAETPEGSSEWYAVKDGKAERITVIENSASIDRYRPNEGDRVAVPEAGEQIEWAETAPLPRLDGATALVPIYAPIVQAFYPENTLLHDMALEYDSKTLCVCSTTPYAYKRLAEGETDLIVCAGPSEEQLRYAAECGTELELTPIGREAFVFIVNGQSPVTDISTDEIRGIYSGKITDWRSLGAAELGEILAYQRPEGSGSQTALIQMMEGMPLMKAPEQLVDDGMEDILETIEYRNFPNAIGYSFRFFVTDMAGSDVRMLKVDGAEPTIENIRSGAYPLVTTFYAVTRKGEENPNVQVLLDYFTSPAGQSLIEKSGYAGIGALGE